MVQEMHDKVETMAKVSSTGDQKFVETGPGAVTKPPQKAEFEEIRHKFHKVNFQANKRSSGPLLP